MASKPQDHLAAAGEPRTVEVDGIKVTIDPASLDDWDLMEAIYDLQEYPDRNALKVVPFLRLLLGETQYESVKAHLRDPGTGRLTGERMGDFLAALFEELNPNS